MLGVPSHSFPVSATSEKQWSCSNAQALQRRVESDWLLMFLLFLSWGKKGTESDCNNITVIIL